MRKSAKENTFDLLVGNLTSYLVRSLETCGFSPHLSRKWCLGIVKDYLFRTLCGDNGKAIYARLKLQKKYFYSLSDIEFNRVLSESVVMFKTLSGLMYALKDSHLSFYTRTDEKMCVMAFLYAYRGLDVSFLSEGINKFLFRAAFIDACNAYSRHSSRIPIGQRRQVACINIFKLSRLKSRFNYKKVEV